MKALTAHRRLVTDRNGNRKYLLAIGVRGFACFNGFNESEAFRKKEDTNLYIVTDEQGGFDGSNPTNYFTVKANADAYCRDKTLGNWECVGIGWIYNNSAPGVNAPLQGQPNAPEAHKYDFIIGNALRREGFIARYYDAWNSGFKTTTRELTPMEQYLSRVFSQFETENRANVPQEVQRASLFANAVQWNQTCAGCLYQFVGAERPSGQAVAYLQTFRNVSEMQYSGWVAANAPKYTALVLAANTFNQGTESIFPLMDHLVNYGTDNAITCYAGAGVMLHAMKYGFWSLREFFRDSRSMVTEGRYDKGSQSDVLCRNYRTRVQESRLQAVTEMAEFTGLKNGTASASTINPAARVTHQNIMSAARQGTLDRLIEVVSADIRALARTDVSNHVNAIIAAARRQPDVRVPPPAPAPAPTPRAPAQGAAQSATPRNATAGAAQGFVQWTSTAVH